MGYMNVYFLYYSLEIDAVHFTCFKSVYLMVFFHPFRSKYSISILKKTMLLTSDHNRGLTVFPGGTSTSMP